MELSYKSLSNLAERFDWQYCSGYGEPGYGQSTTTAVVLGNYWCRCDKVLKEDGSKDLHSLGLHHPRVFAQMEAQGIELEWEDEWTIDYDNDKAYRTSGDSYHWQSSIHWTEDGDIITPDDDLERWLEVMVNNPRMCLPSRVFRKVQLVEAGWESWNGTYESGWHPGQTDDPTTITEEIRRELGDTVDVVFLLDESSQFYIGFSVWTKRVETDDDDEYVSRCPACGSPIDYCQGHGEIGDPAGWEILQAHDNGDHDGCDEEGCDER